MNQFSKNTHWVASFFMFAGGLPFLLFIQALKKQDLKVLLKDAQVIGYLKLIVIASLCVALWLVYRDNYLLPDALRVATFNIISVITTTGYGLDDFTTWGTFPSIIFAFVMMAGACSGSTAGGIKIFRFQIATSMLKKQVMLLIHPSGTFVQRYNGRPITDDIVRSVVAFGLTFFLTIIIISVILGSLGLDATTSITGSITAVANVGPAMGNIIGPTGNFSSLPDTAKWVLSIGMLMGRLEILTILVLFFPAFWKS